MHFHVGFCRNSYWGAATVIIVNSLLACFILWQFPCGRWRHFLDCKENRIRDLRPVSWALLRVAFPLLGLAQSKYIDNAFIFFKKKIFFFFLITQVPLSHLQTYEWTKKRCWLPNPPSTLLLTAAGLVILMELWNTLLWLWERPMVSVII